jgi:hypothetical protein
LETHDLALKTPFGGQLNMIFVSPGKVSEKRKVANIFSTLILIYDLIISRNPL